MPIASRLTNTGTLIVNGSFDEFTGAPVVDSSLQLWLDAGQTTSYSGSGSTWTDLSTSLNNGTLTDSPVFRTREGGGSFNFTGTACVTMAAEMPNVGSRSVTVAFRATDVTTRSGLISTRDGAGGWFIAINRTGGGSIDYCHNNVGNGQTIAPAGTVVANTWYIMTVVYDLSTTLARIYLNGSLVAGPTVMDTVLATVGLSSFVAKEINSPLTLQGDIGDVILYNRVLTPAEVTQNYNALRNRYALPAVTATQMPVVKRQLSSGTLLVNSGGFDEFTGAPVVDANLMVWLDAGQSTSYSGTGNIWTNLANVSANTTLVNSPAFNTQGWLAFNGTDQSASTGLPGATTFTTDSNFTISCWARLSAYKPAAASIGTLVGALAYQGYGIYWSGSPTSYTFGTYMRYSSVTSGVTSATVSLNTWYLVTQVYSRTGNFHQLYLNGTLSGSTTTISGTFNSNLTNVFISVAGGTPGVSDGTPGGGTAGTPFLGDISQVLIYNRALSAAEITQNYNAGCQRYGLAPNTTTQMPVVQRQLSSGTLLVNSGGFDEFTGIASVVEGLVAYYDPAYSSSYSGSGANLYNLVDGVAATLNGTYSAGTAAVGTSVSGTQTIRLTNSDLVTAVNNISHIQAPSFTNITTVSIWFYQHTYNDIARYILDGRTGGSEGWIYNGSLGSNWSTGIVYVNGGASSGTPSWLNWGGTATGVWKNVTFIASTPFTDDINIFSRWSDNEGLDVTFGPILIYNRVLTQAENLQNFNALRNRYGI